MMKLTLAAALIGTALLTAAPAQADAYDAMFEAADYLANKYGVVAYTTHAPLDYGVYGMTVGDTITFNTLYVENPALLRASLVDDVMMGYHPGENCTPQQWIAAHEFAHVLDNLTGRTARDELNYALANGFGGEVSGYALTSDAEAIAEAFVAVECGTPTPAESAIYTMLTT